MPDADVRTPTREKDGKKKRADEPATKETEDPEPEAKTKSARKATGKKAAGKKPTGRKGAEKKPTGKSKAADEADADAPAEEQDAVGPGGAWYSGDFLDAVWGPPPFDAEEDEPPAVDDAKARVPDPSAGDGAKAAFAFAPTYAPEPPEIDPPGSMDWLLGLIGETLAARQEPTAEAKETERVASVEEPVDASVEEPAEAARAANDDAKDATTPQPVATRPAVTIPPGGATRRRAYVATSHNPDHDPEAYIPVVLFDESERWRPSARQKRVGAVALAIIALAIAVQFFRGAFGGNPTIPSVPVPPPPATVTAAASPTSEFVSLVDGFLTNLQGFRERLVEFRLGQTDCAAIAAEIVAVAGAHSLLEAYVARNPDVSDRFDVLDAEFDVTVGRFASTGCATPPELTPDAEADPAP